MAKLSGVELSKAALSHPPVPRQGRWPLPEGPVSPDPTFAADAEERLPAEPLRRGAAGAVEGLEADEGLAGACRNFRPRP